MLASVNIVKGRVVRSCKGNPRGPIGVYVRNALIVREFISGTVVYAVHGLDLAAGFRKINRYSIHGSGSPL